MDIKLNDKLSPSMVNLTVQEVGLLDCGRILATELKFWPNLNKKNLVKLYVTYL